MPWFRLLRPHQWVKNIFVFAGLVFARKLTDDAAVIKSLAGFWLFCLVSSAVYVINDIRDREEDKLHPRKCKRPIAAGEIGVAAAGAMAAALLVAGLGGSLALDRAFSVFVFAYFLLQVAYNLALKHAVILDVIVLGTGFVLRAMSGAALIHVAISPWLVLCTFTLCLFMGFSKRRCELNALTENNGAQAGKHRKTLSIYTRDLLNHMTTLTAGVAITSFMLYTMDNRIVAPFEKQNLVYTVPIVVYAIFRFALLVERGEVDGPTDVVLKDRPFQAAIVAWTLAAYVVVYQPGWIRTVSETIGTATSMPAISN